MKKTNNEQGRSMVEMLGVLAVVGVLSVGGISGYKYAMTQHKVNQLFHDIEIERVDAIEEMNRENPTSYLAETKNSGTFKMEPTCYRPGAPYDSECFSLFFTLENQDVCEAFKKQAPSDWWVILNAHNQGMLLGLHRINCSDSTQIGLGFFMDPNLELTIIK